VQHRRKQIPEGTKPGRARPRVRPIPLDAPVTQTCRPLTAYRPISHPFLHEAYDHPDHGNVFIQHRPRIDVIVVKIDLVLKTNVYGTGHHHRLPAVESRMPQPQCPQEHSLLRLHHFGFKGERTGINMGVERGTILRERPNPSSRWDGSWKSTSSVYSSGRSPNDCALSRP